jgi:hypothetical protein
MPAAQLRPTAIALRDTQTLLLLHPPMAELTREVLRLMEGMGWPMTIFEGLRTAERQWTYFQKGRRARRPGESGVLIPGKGTWVPIDPVKRTGIVTNADGFVKLSNHQAKADGRGYAADCVFLIDGPDLDRDLDDPSWGDDHPWHVYGTLVEHLGGGKVRWLGRGPTLKDMPHIEWIG